MVLLWSLVSAASALAVIPVASQTVDEARLATDAAIREHLGFGSSYALVIGISEFDEERWHELSGVDDETRSVAAALHDLHGFELIEPHYSGRMTVADLTSQIRRFINVYGKNPENRLVIYIATHGFSDPARPEEGGWLIGSDSSPPEARSDYKGYSVKTFTEDLKLLGSLHTYIFLNSCFSGAMLPRFSDVDKDERAYDTTPVTKLSDGAANWTLRMLSQYARMVLTAGDSTQTVPDIDNPFKRAVIDALNGKADGDGNGLLLGSEIAQFVRARVAEETGEGAKINTPVFAVLEHPDKPPRARADAPPDLEAGLNGDFIFLTPSWSPSPVVDTGKSELQAVLDARQDTLRGGLFTECIGCPVMTPLPGAMSDIAMAITETTYADWDECFRQLICQRYIPDDGAGRGDRPVGGVTWQDAYQFVTWLNQVRRDDPECDKYVLPTAEQWQFAARYDTKGEVSWPTAVAMREPVCWGCGPDQSGLTARRTATTPANPAGLYDMVGNLWEWVSSDAPVGGSSNTWPEIAQPFLNDLCATAEMDRTHQCGMGVVMGGSFATSADKLEQSLWGRLPRTDNLDPWSLPTVGFRVACELKPTE